MDQNQILQETLEQSLIEMNKRAMKELAAQIVATVRQLQNGEPDKVKLLWFESETPAALKEFIYSKGVKRYHYVVLLPQGQDSLEIDLGPFNVVKLQLPQNTLLIYS